jgi:exportin-T
MQVSLFGETVTAQQLMFEKCGHDLRTHLATRVLPAVDCPPNIADRPPNIADHICLHIQVDMLVGKLIDSCF